jgi:cell surface protein SprA
VPDSLKLQYPTKDFYTTPAFGKSNLFLDNPQSIVKTVTYDPITKKYIVKETLGGKLIKVPQYLTFKEYQALEQKNIIDSYWKTVVATAAPQTDSDSLIAPVRINSKAFDKIFGGNTISIQPRGSADLTFAGRINRNENPLFNERQRKQGNFDFNQRIQMNVIGQIGTRLKINFNYNSILKIKSK